MPFVSIATDVFALGAFTQYLADHLPTRELSERWQPTLTRPLRSSHLLFDRRRASAHNAVLNEIMDCYTRVDSAQRPTSQEVATELLAEQRRLGALGSIQRVEAIPHWYFEQICEPEVETASGVLPSIVEEGDVW
jgi:hypothetical protein